MIILEALNQASLDWCPWHPLLHLWDFSYVLRPICYAIAEALDGDGSNAIECSILEVDRPNAELYVSASSGQQTEYVHQPLGFESFTGSVAEAAAGVWTRLS